VDQIAEKEAGVTEQTRVDAQSSRVDFLVIADMVEEGSRVLDIGCSDGGLLKLLSEKRHVDGRGMELSQKGVNQCVAHGLSVVQGDADTDLAQYPDQAFDYVILSQTLQATHRPKDVIAQMLRIGRNAIVSFPNFGHWRIRRYIALHGRMPVTDALPQQWYETPNIHFCTIKDFIALCDVAGARIEQRFALNAQGRRVSLGGGNRVANLFAEQAVFLLTR
jgi:methionine biosynthesis protein MetW